MLQIFEASTQNLESVERLALTYGVARAFAEMVNRRLAERGWSLRDFAERAEPTFASASGAVGYVSKVVGGKVRLPVKKFQRWADALRLDGEERDRFIALAWLARSDERVETMFLALESRVAELERSQGPRRAPPG